MRTGEVDAITGDAILGYNRDAAAVKLILDGKLKGVEGYVHYVRADALSTGSSVFKVLPEQLHALRRVSGPGPCLDG